MSKQIFLLSSSGSGVATVDDFAFWRAITDNVDHEIVTVLSIGFASGGRICDDRWYRIQQHLADSIKNILTWVNPHKVIKVLTAEPDPDVFIQQSKLCNAIFAHGGDGDILQAVLEEIPKFRKAIESAEVIAGGSAGANCWADSYYSNDNEAICEGLKIIPIKTFCHYHSAKWVQTNELFLYGNRKLPVITIAEGEYIRYVFNN